MTGSYYYDVYNKCSEAASSPLMLSLPTFLMSTAMCDLSQLMHLVLEQYLILRVWLALR